MCICINVYIYIYISYTVIYVSRICMLKVLLQVTCQMFLIRCMMLFQRRKADRVECISACICPCDYLRASATYECIHLCVYMPLCIYATLALCISYVTFRRSKRSTFRRSKRCTFRRSKRSTFRRSKRAPDRSKRQSGARITINHQTVIHNCLWWFITWFCPWMEHNIPKMTNQIKNSVFQTISLSCVPYVVSENLIKLSQDKPTWYRLRVEVFLLWRERLLSDNGTFRPWNDGIYPYAGLFLANKTLPSGYLLHSHGSYSP